jgi:hypothetical protein
MDARSVVPFAKATLGEEIGWTRSGAARSYCLATKTKSLAGSSVSENLPNLGSVDNL